MNSSLRKFLSFLANKRKPMHVQMWVQLLCLERNCEAEISFFELEGRHGIARATLYRILADGKPYGVEAKSRKKTICVSFPKEWCDSKESVPVPAVENKIKRGRPPRTLCHTNCIAVYSDWYRDHNGMMPNIMAADAAGMKAIVKYLTNTVRTKYPEISSEECDERVVKAWTAILYHWDKLTPFLQGQVKLSQINSNLTNILHAIKNGKSSQAGSRSSRFAATEQELNSDSGNE
jgi:hypothetical protein